MNKVKKTIFIFLNKISLLWNIFKCISLQIQIMKFNKITDKRPEVLQDHHMPKSYDISLKAYGGGGTANH